MAAFVRLKPDRPQLDDSVRVLQPDDYRAAVSAEELVTDAEAQADAIREDAKAEFEAEKKRGYDEGMAAAQAEIAEQMMTLVSRSVDYLAHAEQEVARTVMVCLRKILGDFPEDELVLRAARQGLSLIRNEARVTLHVRPDIVSNVRERVGEILQDHGDIGFLEVVADGGLAEGGCRLETELGVVDASIDQQIAALESVIRSAVVKNRPTQEE